MLKLGHFSIWAIFQFYDDCNEKRDSRKFDHPAWGQTNIHAPAFLVRFLFIGWEVWIIENLLENVSTLWESWSLQLVNMICPGVYQTSGPKWKIGQVRQCYLLKNYLTGPRLLPCLPGVDLHLLLLHVEVHQPLLGSPSWLSWPAWPDATRSSSSRAPPCDSR